MERLFAVGVGLWGLTGFVAHAFKRSCSWRWGLLPKNDRRWFFYKNSGLHRRLRLGLVAVVGAFTLMAFLNFYLPSNNPANYGEKLYNVTMSIATGYTVTYLFYRFTIYRERIAQDEQVLEAVKFVAETHISFEALKEKLRTVACFDPDALEIPIKFVNTCSSRQCAFCINSTCFMIYYVSKTVIDEREYNLHNDIILRLKPSLSNIFIFLNKGIFKTQDIKKGHSVFFQMDWINVNLVHLFFLKHKGHNCERALLEEMINTKTSDDLRYLDGENLYETYINLYNDAKQFRSNLIKSDKRFGLFL